MNVTIRGSSPGALALGILLISRARMLGQRVSVEVVGDPADLAVVAGPAILHSAALASCGVGRELGSGALVVVPGPADEPLAISASPDGAGEWFLLDRTGRGIHPAVQAYTALCRDGRPAARKLLRSLRAGMEVLGCAAEPAVLELLVAAPMPPLARLALALRAGRTIASSRGAPVTQWMAGELDGQGTLPTLDVALRRFEPTAAAAIAEAHLAMEALGAGDLAAAVAEIVAHLSMLPARSMLPPLDPAADAVAVGLSRALGAVGPPEQAGSRLLDTYRFLGGRFTDRAEHALELCSDPPPPGRLERWRWLCRDVREAADRLDRSWRDLVDPPM